MNYFKEQPSPACLAILMLTLSLKYSGLISPAGKETTFPYGWIILTTCEFTVGFQVLELLAFSHAICLDMSNSSFMLKLS